MSTVNIGSSLPAGSNTIGNVKIVDVAGTNQAAVDANNNLHIAVYNAANSMAVDSSNNAHVALFNIGNQLAINASGALSDNITQVGGVSLALGQITMSASLPVAIASDQTPLNVVSVGSSITTLNGPASTDNYQATVFAPGELRVSMEPTQLFLDSFDTGLDTVNRWKTPTWGRGGIAALNEATDTRLGTGTLANGWSCLESQPTFGPANPGWLQITYGNNVPYPYIPNTYFFWGTGTSPAIPTAFAPLVDAAGFEIAIGGRLFAVMYQGGVRQQIADLSQATGTRKQPQDAGVHYYHMFYRGDHTYWCIDSLDNVVAQTFTGAPGPNLNTLPLKMMAAAGAGAPPTNGQLICNTVHVSDTARNNVQLSDGVCPWRQATIDVNGNLSVKASATAFISTTLQSSASANSNGATLSVLGMGTVTFTVTGTYQGTVNFEGSEDGVNFYGLQATQLGTNVFGMSTATTGIFQASCAGLQTIRSRISGYATGQITVTAHAIPSPFSTPVVTLSGAGGKLALSASSLTVNADNPITFAGASTVARRVRIQNESGGTVYWDADVTATIGSPSLPSPSANSVMVEWVNIPMTTLHVFVPSGGTAVLNGTGGVKVSAWA